MNRLTFESKDDLLTELNLTFKNYFKDIVTVDQAFIELPSGRRFAFKRHPMLFDPATDLKLVPEASRTFVKSLLSKWSPEDTLYIQSPWEFNLIDPSFLDPHTFDICSELRPGKLVLKSTFRVLNDHIKK